MATTSTTTSTTTSRKRTTVRLVVALMAFGVLSSSCAAVVRTSVDTAGGDPDSESQDVALSEDGRFAAFASFAGDLVPNDNNGVKDIFVRDHQTGVTELISLSMNGGSANGTSGQPDITPDGRFVVFWSFGDDLVPGDTNGGSDVFVFDRDTDTMELVSVATDGSQGLGALGGSISDNGQRVAFYEYGSLDPNDTNSSHDVYVRDRVLATTKLMSTVEGGTAAAGLSYDPVISGVGTEIAFHTSSDDVIALDTNGFSDVVWRTVVLNIRQLVSINTSGGSGNLHSYNPSISRLGDIVAFESSASDLVVGDIAGFGDVFRRDVFGLSTERVSQRPSGGGFVEGNGNSFLPSISADGTMIAYGSSANNLADPADTPADTNGFSDVYIWDAGENTLGSQTMQ
ncbi:MAG: hypothetical protein HKN26_02980, partial [Acidimicrobiales bacterium]|nr:hypothetical protein [Acidimicrobiales bacterium]